MKLFKTKPKKFPVKITAQNSDKPEYVFEVLGAYIHYDNTREQCVLELLFLDLSTEYTDDIIEKTVLSLNIYRKAIENFLSTKYSTYINIEGLDIAGSIKYMIHESGKASLKIVCQDLKALLK